MSKFKVTCYLACVAVLLMMVAALIAQPVALAASRDITAVSSLSPAQESQDAEGITLTSRFPVLSSYAGTYFAYSIEMLYQGEEQRVFDLHVDVPPGFNYSITSGYEEGTEIAAIRLDPAKTYPDTIKVTVRPYIWLIPEPGEYTVTVEASSEEIKNSIELKAIITAKHDLALTTTTGRLNIEATAGEDNHFSVAISNDGSAELQNIELISKAKDKPSGWTVTFDPEKIDSLPVGVTREIDVNVQPPERTIAGDYMITIEAEPESRYAWDNVEIRVTVLTPTVWGWVGVGIVIVVIIGLVVMFMRLGRR